MGGGYLRVGGAYLTPPPSILAIYGPILIIFSLLDSGECMDGYGGQKMPPTKNVFKIFFGINGIPGGYKKKRASNVFGLSKKWPF